MRPFILALLLLCTTTTTTSADIIIDINGTEAAPIIDISADNNTFFSSSTNGTLIFHLGPNPPAADQISYRQQVSPTAPLDDFQFRVPTDGSYINLLQIENETPFFLDPFNSIQVSGPVQDGAIGTLAAFDGLTSTMNRAVGSGNVTSTPVTFNYNIAAVPEPSSFALLGLATVGACFRRRLSACFRRRPRTSVV